jgi:hypothetical protein
MHRLQERDQRLDFGGPQVLPVCGHVATTLQYLSHQLIAREAGRRVVEGRPAPPALAAERVTVPALLALDEECPLQLGLTRRR